MKRWYCTHYLVSSVETAALWIRSPLEVSIPGQRATSIATGFGTADSISVVLDSRIHVGGAKELSMETVCGGRYVKLDPSELCNLAPGVPRLSFQGE